MASPTRALSAKRLKRAGGKKINEKERKSVESTLTNLFYPIRAANAN